MNDKKVYLPEYQRYVEEDILVSKIATYIFVTVSHETTTGAWCVTGEEIQEGLMIPYLFIKRHVKEIEEELWKMFGNDLISDIEIYEQDEDVVFDVNLWHCAIYGFAEDDACFLTEEEAD